MNSTYVCVSVFRASVGTWVLVSGDRLTTCVAFGIGLIFSSMGVLTVYGFDAYLCL